jgi:hypothetical protein
MKKIYIINLFILFVIWWQISYASIQNIKELYNQVDDSGFIAVPMNFSQQEKDALIRINASNPKNLQDIFDLPRWHFDYISNGVLCKFVMALKGPQTLYVKLSQRKRNEIIKILGEYKDMEDLKIIRGKIANLVKLCISKNQCFLYDGKEYTGVIHKLGDFTSAALHSEPPIHSERLFLSIK